MVVKVRKASECLCGDTVTTEINTIEDIIKLGEEYGNHRIIVSPRYTVNGVTDVVLTIYDDYIE